MEAATRINQMGPMLTRAERRIAEVVLQRPQLVAFGTVAELAAAADAGGATVVRLAAKLGYDGFTALQTSIQLDLAKQLRPAAVRIREQSPTDVVDTHLRLEVENVRATLQGESAATLPAVVSLLASESARVHVLSGDASRGVAVQFHDDLQALRAGVSLVGGNEVRVTRALALLDEQDVVVAVDLRRYDSWVVESVKLAKESGAKIVAVSDSLLSPLAVLADENLVIVAAGAGPFDSHVGTLALFNLVIAGVAEVLRKSATERLERAEGAWRRANVLIDR
jgi:DNA-binding MurR/RpiR family transcriptional regulator